MVRSRNTKVPEPIIRKTKSLAELLNIPATKAFQVQHKFIMGDFEVKKSRKKRGKKSANIFELEFKF